jgi:glycosyltransferase involved in cell wall biosynthesis
MPVCNRVDFLAEAIESILQQSYPHFEYIIVDDGSTDGSRDIISRYAARDSRLRPFFHEHQGAAGAMNDGVSLARGAWIARMDSDDIALPERLSASLDWAERQGLDVCGGQVETFGSDVSLLWYPQEHDAICRELLFRHALLQPVALFRTAVLKENPYVAGCQHEDYELFTRLAPRYRLGNAPRVLLRYRRHETQIHVVRCGEFREDFQKYRFRYFYEMYPRTSLAEYLPLARVSDLLPLRTMSELQRAGRWLVELADQPDSRLQDRMARRWQEACARSASLGDGVEAVFRRFQDLLQRKDL